jgi:glycosyltransferase involved in cell wall biosynthesis
MHHSGTPILAAFLRASGLNLGESCLHADEPAPAGEDEDREFLELQREMLLACTVAESGWRDWGWTESQRLDFSCLPSFRPRAEALVRRRQEAGRPWGWADPRTTILLTFWDEILPGARYVFTYRSPWEVAASLAALHRPPFLDAPSFVPRVWCFYNRQLLDFYRRHRDRCLLLETGTLLSRPDEALALFRAKLGLCPDAARSGADILRDVRSQLSQLSPGSQGSHHDDWGPESFDGNHGTAGLRRLSARLYPREAQIWSDLEQAADLAAGREAMAVPAALDARSAPDRPTSTVVIPCCNQGEFLLAAVASAEDSEDIKLELIVVNDGSTDRFTVEILERLRAAGYRILDQPNRGVSAARNTGVEAARGRYILPLDADNRIRSSYLRQAAEILDADPEVGVVYGDAALLGGRSGSWRMPDFNLDEMSTGNRIDACGVFRREVWQQCGGYDEDVELGWEDWDFWLSVAEKGWRFVHVNEVMFDYRLQSESISASGARQEYRRLSLEFIIGKHPAIFQPRLPKMFADKDAHWQQAEARAALLERSRDEVRDGLAAAQHDLQGLREELHGTSAELAAARSELAAARNALEAARSALAAAQSELRTWQQHVAFMTGTRAWRLRSGLLRLRQALGLLRRA